jgi:nucleoside-diphosphate-sugar epimerase
MIPIFLYVEEIRLFDNIMKILITGASGFVGQNLVQHLLDDESGQYSLVLTDIVLPSVPKGVKWPEKAKCIQADLFSDAAAVVDEEIDAVYMFHGIMSSAAEADFDLGEYTRQIGKTSVDISI